jgi:tetrahydromethanopterin S-methyltransferase subunit G
VRRRDVVTIEGEGRLAHVEGRLAEQSSLFVLIESRLTALDQKIDQKITALEQKIDQKITALDQKFDLKIMALDQKFDQRLAALDQKFDQRLAALDQKFDQRLAALDREIGSLRRDMASQFRWTTGMFLTGVVTILAAILAQ